MSGVGGLLDALEKLPPAGQPGGGQHRPFSRRIVLEHLPQGEMMSTLDGPGPFDGVDPQTLTSEKRVRRLEAWFDAGVAEERAKRGRELIPGVDYSEVKARDIMGSVAVRGVEALYDIPPEGAAWPSDTPPALRERVERERERRRSESARDGEGQVDG